MRDLERFDKFCSKLEGAWSQKARSVYDEAVRCIKRASRVTDLRALEILLSGKLGEAPSKTERFGKHYEAVIGIGKDHVAFLTLDADALSELRKMKAGT